jgi:hypothetical protein
MTSVLIAGLPSQKSSGTKAGQSIAKPFSCRHRDRSKSGRTKNRSHYLEPHRKSGVKEIGHASSSPPMLQRSMCGTGQSWSPQPRQRVSAWGDPRRSSTRRGLPLFAHRALAGSGSLQTWGLESGRFIASPERVPKFSKGFLNPPASGLATLGTIHLRGLTLPRFFLTLLPQRFTIFP